MFSSFPSLRAAQSFYFFVFICLLSYGLSYDYAFVHVEQTESTKREHLRNGLSFTRADLVRMFDTSMWEGAGRPTRPLSSLLDIIDTKFRATCWRFFAPRPALSLTWIFSLVLGPLLLILFLGKLGVDPVLSWLVGAFYLSSQSLGSLICMHFRSGKPMVNFFLLVLLWMASRYAEPLKNWRPKQRRRAFSLMVFTLILSFIFDETALVGFPMLLYFCPDLLRNKSQKRILLSVPVFMGVLYFWFFPRLTGWLGFRGGPKLDGYIYEEVVGRGELQKIFTHLFINAGLLVRDNLALFSPFQPANRGLRILLLLNWLLWAGFFVAAVVVYRREKRGDGFAVTRKFGLFSIAVAMGHTLLHGGHLVSPYRYGTYFIVFFSIWIALVSVRLPKAWVALTLVITTAASLICLSFTNRIQKSLTFYEPGLRLEQGEVNRFTHVSPSAYANVAQATREYWVHRERLFFLPTFDELGYLKAELRPGFVVPLAPPE